MINYRIIVLLLGSLIILGCQSKPVLPVPENNPPVMAVQNKPKAYEGKQITWGGVIISSAVKENRTEVTILSKRMENNTRPVETDTSLGRFIARFKGFVDPAVLATGRELTITGVIKGTENRKVGEFDYSYPVVDVDQHHLWPVRIKYRDDYYWWDPWYGPWYYPYPYYHHHHRVIKDVY